MPGDASPIVRGSIWCAGACAVISGVIVSPAVISGAANGCVNSFPFVRSLVLVVVLVVDATICIADMHCRYGEPICKAGKQKRPRACCSWPLTIGLANTNPYSQIFLIWRARILTEPIVSSRITQLLLPYRLSPVDCGNAEQIPIP